MACFALDGDGQDDIFTYALPGFTRTEVASNIFSSFNQGLVHYVGFSADAYTYRSGSQLLANQLAFLKADLAKVDRKVTPWVVALVHKDWDMEGEAYAAIYPVLDAGNVDLLFCGHIVRGRPPPRTHPAGPSLTPDKPSHRSTTITASCPTTA